MRAAGAQYRRPLPEPPVAVTADVEPLVAAQRIIQAAPRMSARAAWTLACCAAVGMLLWTGYWYHATAFSMVDTWRSSDTYAHGFLVLPVCVWLIWRKRDELAQVVPHRDLRALPLLAVPGIAWLLGELSGVRVVQQFSLIATIAVVAWTLLGGTVLKLLAFPLAFLLFAVPAGDFLLPWLMERTADFTVLALQASGVPVYRDGLQISVPTGNWSVVEACSGLRYLIACVTGGVLYAYLRYRRLGRRIAFIAAAIVVPIVANWLRAYLIVMIAQASGGKIAADVDHLLYGWVFFSVVTLLLFGVASMWREDTSAVQPQRPASLLPHRFSSSGRAFLGTALAAAVATAVWPAAAWQLDAALAGTVPALSAPDVPGWQLQNGRMGAWQPHYASRVAVDGIYASGDKRVGVHIAYYRDQRRGPELVSSLNRLVSGTDAWRVLSERTYDVKIAQQNLPVIVSRIERPGSRYLVWRWYWIDGARTSNGYVAKLMQLRARLLGRGDDGAAVIVYAEADDHHRDAGRTLEEFAAAAMPGITRTLEHARSS
ncbi:MAG: exosortase A [Rhodospirillaceae bacterium]